MKPIEDLAREAGFARNDSGDYPLPLRDAWLCDTAELERFAALIRAEVLEEAAQHVEDRYGTLSPCDLAAAIRALAVPAGESDNRRGGECAG